MKINVKKPLRAVSLFLVFVMLTATACSANTVQIDNADVPLQSETEHTDTVRSKVTQPGTEQPETLDTEITQPSSDGLLENPGKPEQNATLYRSSSYTVFTNELIDTYFIACGLLFNFEGDYLFDPAMNVDYQQTKEHFSPYSDHPFIHELESYADMQNKYADIGVLYYLAQYVISMSNTGLGIANIQSDSFESDEAFYTFINDLNQFYQDTGAKEFFETSKLHESQKQYLSEHMKDVPVDAFLQEMERYVGNQSQVFGSSQIHYCSLVSVYKSPNNASFHTFGMNQDMYLTSIQSPLGFDGNFSASQLFESHQHEALHMFINQGVENQAQLIESLAKDKSPSDYASSQYTNMPWHRITDEAIVRAVQARIYGIVHKDPEYGYQEILSKEINAGFQNLDTIYHSLEEYETNRSQYPTIDDYLPKLIESYLN